MLHVFTSLLGGAPFVHSLGIVQWDSTRRDHPGYPGRVSGSGPVSLLVSLLLRHLSMMRVVRWAILRFMMGIWYGTLLNSE